MANKHWAASAGIREKGGTCAVIINGTNEKPLILEDDTVVGVGACVIRDVSASTFIGEGATVVKNILDKVLAFGNPCKNIRTVSIGEKLV